MQLRGCGTALVTPFHQDGSIDGTALRNLVAWQIESGIDFLVPCGTTGETPTLSHDEWLYVIDTTIEVAAGRDRARSAAAQTTYLCLPPGRCGGLRKPSSVSDQRKAAAQCGGHEHCTADHHERPSPAHAALCI